MSGTRPPARRPPRAATTEPNAGSDLRAFSERRSRAPPARPLSAIGTHPPRRAAGCRLYDLSCGRIGGRHSIGIVRLAAVHPLIRLWLRLNRARWRDDHGRRERRRKIVAELAPGRTFVDIGGMWSLNGEIAFWAEEAGATKVTLVDAFDPSEEFQAEHARRGSSVTYLQADLHEPESIELIGPHDVVWCTGVLYHTPHPYLQFEHLRRLTKERLFLGTHVIPEIPGFPGASIFYPLLDDSAREAYASAYRRDQLRAAVAQPFSFEPGWEYANWWWGITPSALRAMMAVAGFEIIEEHRPEALFMDILAAPTPSEWTTPPFDYTRRRGLERLANVPAGERPEWASPAESTDDLPS